MKTYMLDQQQTHNDSNSNYNNDDDDKNTEVTLEKRGKKTKQNQGAQNQSSP